MARVPEATSPSEAAVYAALIDSLYQHPLPETLLVSDSTLTICVPRGGAASWRAQLDSIPSGLPAALETISSAKRSSASLPLPRPVRILTEATLRELFAGGPRRGWEEFARRYPGQRRYSAFSPVAFSSDGGEALVYYEYHCGGRCGAGIVVWLTRRRDGRWGVRKLVGLWVS